MFTDVEQLRRSRQNVANKGHYLYKSAPAERTPKISGYRQSGLALSLQQGMCICNTVNEQGEEPHCIHRFPDQKVYLHFADLLCVCTSLQRQNTCLICYLYTCTDVFHYTTIPVTQMFCFTFVCARERTQVQENSFRWTETIKNLSLPVKQTWGAHCAPLRCQAFLSHPITPNPIALLKNRKSKLCLEKTKNRP